MFSDNFSRILAGNIARAMELADGAEPTERERRDMEFNVASDAEWDRLRALLLPCPKCKAVSAGLMFKTMRLLQSAHVCCRK